MRGAIRAAGERRRWVGLALAVVAVASFSLAGCSKGSEDVLIRVVRLPDGKAGYGPEVTTVQKGERVKLVVFNTTDIVHGLTIEGYGEPPLEIGPDAPNNVPFTADKAGTYKIFCQLHPEHVPAVFIVE